MDDTIRGLSECYAQTLSTDSAVRKAAEATIRNLSLQANYGLTVLQIVSLDTLPVEIRQAAAVTFKNHVKYRWVPHEADSLTGTAQPPLPEEEKATIKSLITGLMLSTPPIVQAQISEALSIISSHDFPQHWPTLLPELVEKLGSGAPQVVNGVLLTANSIFERYRGQYMTDALNTELTYLQHFIEPLLKAFVALRPQIEAAASDVETLKLLLSSAHFACQIFFSLNSPGLTEEFEKMLNNWMDEFHWYLVYNNPLLVERDSEKQSAPDAVKAAVCENINLFMERNEEEFEKYLNKFAGDVWQLLVSVSQNPGQDALAMSAIRFLTCVSKSVSHKLFASPDILKQICESIIIPNLQLRDQDEELFEMNYVDYIRRDTEGSDQDTRRRAACDLVKALTDKFPAEVTQLFTEYVKVMLNTYAQSPASNWKAKDCAMYLLTALAVKASVQQAGVTATNQFVDVNVFFEQQVMPELQAADVNDLPVLKADSLKFLTTFRSQLPKTQLVSLFPSLVHLLTAESNVVHSYAAIAVERVLSSKDHGMPRFTPADVSTSLEALVTRLFEAFQKPESAENEYVMKCVMRVISFVGLQIAPVATAALQQLSQMLLAACKNPTQPGFNHYLFESIAALVNNGCAANPAMLGQFEAAVFPAFQVVLSEDVQEFHPYIFQILAQLLELRVAPLPEVYVHKLLPGFVSPTFWERSGNIPALTRLMQAYIDKAPAELASSGQLRPLLGVFQKLIASRIHDHEGFYILQSLMLHVDMALLRPFLPTVWNLLLQRLQHARTTKYQRQFVLFLCLMLAKHGVPSVRDALDDMQRQQQQQEQHGLFLQLIENVLLPTLPGVHEHSDRAVAAVGATRLLCECSEVLEAKPKQASHTLWARLLEAVVQLLEGNENEAAGADIEDVGGEEYTGYTAAFARLHNAGQPSRDLLPDVKDPRIFLAASLAAFSHAHPGRIRQLVADHTQQITQAALQSYCSTAGVLIA